MPMISQRARQLRVLNGEPPGRPSLVMTGVVALGRVSCGLSFLQPAASANKSTMSINGAGLVGASLIGLCGGVAAREWRAIGNVSDAVERAFHHAVGGLLEERERLLGAADGRD